MTTIILPKIIKKARDPCFPRKVQIVLKCEFCGSEVLSRKNASKIPFLQDEERSERHGPQQMMRHAVVLKQNVSL